MTQASDGAGTGACVDDERRRPGLLGDVREAIFGAEDGLVGADVVRTDSSHTTEAGQNWIDMIALAMRRSRACGGTRLTKLAMSLLATIALSVLIAGSTATTAAAYGSTAVYQIAFSGNCDDPANPLCAPNAFGVGGIWVWAELDRGGTGDATVAFCTHGLPTAPHGGAFGSPTEITWTMITFSGNPFTIGSVNQDPNNTYLVISTPFGPLPTIPATPGHYSFSAGPAVQAQTQVTLIPGR